MARERGEIRLNRATALLDRAGGDRRRADPADRQRFRRRDARPAQRFFRQPLYLGVWGTVLAVGILRSGRRLADTARSLAMWMLIILVFVAGYQYRYELQDFANRVTVGLVPGSPLTINDGGNTVMLESSPTAISARAARSTARASTSSSTPAPPAPC